VPDHKPTEYKICRDCLRIYKVPGVTTEEQTKEIKASPESLGDFWSPETVGTSLGQGGCPFEEILINWSCRRKPR